MDCRAGLRIQFEDEVEEARQPRRPEQLKKVNAQEERMAR